MTRKMAVKASLFTLILAFTVLGTFTVKAVMNKDKETNTELTEVTKQLQDQWYFVSVVDEQDPSTWHIGAMRTPPDAAPDDDECRILNDGEHCAIQLEFSLSDDPEDFENTTLAQAISSGATNTNLAYQPEP